MSPGTRTRKGVGSCYARSRATAANRDSSQRARSACTPALGFSIASPTYAFLLVDRFAFTDRSQVDRIQLAPLATTDIDFYGVHVGFLFSNREVHPDRPDVERKHKSDEFGLSIALGLRYAFGGGDVLARLFPPQYDPTAVETFPTSSKVHEVALNLGAKVLF